MGVIDGIEAEARTIATDGPESDGTLEWQDTTIVLARVRAGGETGVGYTYAERSVAGLIESKLETAPRRLRGGLRRARHDARPGAAMTAGAPTAGRQRSASLAGATESARQGCCRPRSSHHAGGRSQAAAPPGKFRPVGRSWARPGAVSELWRRVWVGAAEDVRVTERRRALLLWCRRRRGLAV